MAQIPNVCAVISQLANIVFVITVAGNVNASFCLFATCLKVAMLRARCTCKKSQNRTSK